MKVGIDNGKLKEDIVQVMIRSKWNSSILSKGGREMHLS